MGHGPLMEASGQDSRPAQTMVESFQGDAAGTETPIARPSSRLRSNAPASEALSDRQACPQTCPLNYAGPSDPDLQRSESETPLAKLHTPSRASFFSATKSVKKKAKTLASKKILEAISLVHGKPSGAAMGVDYKDTRTLRGNIYRVVSHKFFTMFISTIIALNAIWIGVEMDMTVAGKNDENFYIVEACFASIFLVELTARLFAERGNFFLDSENRWWNVFDFVLVSAAVLDTFVLQFLNDGEAVNDLDGIIVLRILRLARLARVVRLLRMFHELWLLVAGVFNAFRTLVWVWLLLLILTYIFAIFVTRTLGQAKNSSPEVYSFFGRVPWSMYTLFCVMTTEGWADVARATMDVQPWSCFLFMLFMSMTTFAVMNVVVAIVVNNTLEVATRDKDTLRKREEAERQKTILKIHEVFVQADGDGNGMLMRDEFLGAIENPRVTQLLHEIGVDVRQAENLFDILDYDESGYLEPMEFMEGVMATRGDATAKDILAVRADLWKTERSVRNSLFAMRTDLRKALDSVDKSLSQAVGRTFALRISSPGGAIGGDPIPIPNSHL